jgi:hypothetical protein
MESECGLNFSLCLIQETRVAKGKERTVTKLLKLFCKQTNRHSSLITFISVTGIFSQFMLANLILS